MKGLDRFKSYNWEETLRRGRILKCPSGDTRNLNMLIVMVQANENFDTSLRLITRTRAPRRVFIEPLYVEFVFGLIFEGLVTDFV
jgi:hypothetical protein